MGTISEHNIKPIVYRNSDIREVRQLRISFTSGDPDLLILPALDNHSIIILGWRYKAVASGTITFKTDSETIISEYFGVGDAYGRSPSDGFLFAIPENKSLYYTSDVNSNCLLFVGYYNSLGINQ